MMLRLAAGTITAGGTLGILIPPSIMLVVMGPIMEIPVIDLICCCYNTWNSSCKFIRWLHNNKMHDKS